LRLRNISGSQIGDALAQVGAHCTDSGEAPEEAFGDPVAYATHVAEQVRPVDLALSMSPLRAGLLGLAVLFAVPTLLSGVSGLARGGPAELSVGSLVGAGVGTAAIALVVRFASMLKDPRQRGRQFGAMWLFLAAMMWPSIVWTSIAVELSAWLSVGIAVVLLAATWVSLRATGPDVVVDPLTGDSLPTPPAGTRRALAAARDPRRCHLAHPVCAWALTRFRDGCAHREKAATSSQRGSCSGTGSFNEDDSTILGACQYSQRDP